MRSVHWSRDPAFEAMMVSYKHKQKYTTNVCAILWNAISLNV